MSRNFREYLVCESEEEIVIEIHTDDIEQLLNYLGVDLEEDDENGKIT